MDQKPGKGVGREGIPLSSTPLRKIIAVQGLRFRPGGWFGRWNPQKKITTKDASLAFCVSFKNRTHQYLYVKICVY